MDLHDARAVLAALVSLTEHPEGVEALPVVFAELDAARTELAALRPVADAVKTALTEGYPLHPDVRKAYGAIVVGQLAQLDARAAAPLA